MSAVLPSRLGHGESRDENGRTEGAAGGARLAFLLIAGASLAFAIGDSIVKVVVAALPVPHVVFFRNVLGFALLYAWLRARKEPIAPRNLRVLVLRGVLGCVAISLLFASIARIHLAHAILLNKTSPVFTTLLAALFLGQRPTVASVAGVLVTLPGVWLVLVRPDAPAGGGAEVGIGSLAISTGAVLGLLSGLASGGAQTSLSHLGRSDRSGVVVLFFCAIAALLTLPFVLWHPVWPAPRVVPAIVSIAFFSTLGQVLMTEAYQRSSASAASTSSLQNVVFVALIGVVAFGEVPTLRAAAGGLLVLAGGAIATFGRSPRPAPSPSVTA